MTLTGIFRVAFTSLVLFSSCANKSANQPPQQRQLARAVAPPETLGAPADLPQALRVILQTRMASHARDMSALVKAIMILRYREIETLSLALAANADFARPLSGDATELNSFLPEAFFSLQDELKSQATVLATAANKQSALAVAAAYGEVSETCVKCHSVYRDGKR